MDWSSHVYSEREAGNWSEAVVESSSCSLPPKSYPTTPWHLPPQAAASLDSKDAVKSQLLLSTLWKTEETLTSNKPDKHIGCVILGAQGDPPLMYSRHQQQPVPISLQWGGDHSLSFALTSVCTFPIFGTIGTFGTSHDKLECTRDFWNTTRTTHARVASVQRSTVEHEFNYTKY